MAGRAGRQAGATDGGIGRAAARALDHGGRRLRGRRLRALHRPGHHGEAALRPLRHLPDRLPQRALRPRADERARRQRWDRPAPHPAALCSCAAWPLLDHRRAVGLLCLQPDGDRRRLRAALLDAPADHGALRAAPRRDGRLAALECRAGRLRRCAADAATGCRSPPGRLAGGPRRCPGRRSGDHHPAQAARHRKLGELRRLRQSLGRARHRHRPSLRLRAAQHFPISASAFSAARSGGSPFSFWSRPIAAPP